MSSTFSAKIDPALAPQMKADLIEMGFEISKLPYACFAASKPGVKVVLYESGALVIQGKEMKELIEFYIEPKILQDFRFTQKEAYVDLIPHIGVDEAGKGDFFGPLCVAAVYADEAGIRELLQMKVADSKTLSDKRIEEFAKKIEARFPHKVLKLFPETYNRLYSRFKNLNRLLAWGHATVIEELIAKTGATKATIDQFGSPHLVENAIAQKKLSLELTQRTKGEEDPVVAAASILARSAFVKGIKALSDEIGFELPKGNAQIVKDAAVRLVKREGEAVLDRAAKRHFKTTAETLDAAKD